MKKKTYMLIMGLTLTAIFGYGIMLNTISVTQPVQAQVAKGVTNRQKWEHCSVLSINLISTNAGKNTGAAMIYYVRDGSYQSEKIEAVSGSNGLDNINKVKTNALAKAISKLQDEGWEMVGEGSLLPYGSTDQKMIYFKRSL